MTMDDAQTLLTDLSLSFIILKNGIHEEKKIGHMFETIICSCMTS